MLAHSASEAGPASGKDGSLGIGFAQAVGKVDRHRLQNRDYAKRYAIGVLGTDSLLTQLRHQHPDITSAPIQDRLNSASSAPRFHDHWGQNRRGMLDQRTAKSGRVASTRPPWQAVRCRRRDGLVNLGAAGWWGAFGGLAVEAIELYGAVRRAKTWPWNVVGETPLGPYVFSVVLRVFLGCGLGIAAAASGQVAGAFGAIGVGVAAPLIVEQLGKLQQGDGANVGGGGPKAHQDRDERPAVAAKTAPVGDISSSASDDQEVAE